MFVYLKAFALVPIACIGVFTALPFSDPVFAPHGWRDSLYIICFLFPAYVALLCAAKWVWGWPSERVVFGQTKFGWLTLGLLGYIVGIAGGMLPLLLQS